jgi:amidophosphoribosyltransferase
MVSDKLNEECGVFGLYSKKQIDTFSLMQFGLIALQHRGQEACGISFLSKKNIYSFKKEGLVIEAFSLIDNPELYQGNAAIGHTRYSTTGGQSKRNIQPLFTKNEKGEVYISLAHNGNLVNSAPLRTQLEKEGLEFVSNHSDTEVMLRIIQKHFNEGLEKAVTEVFKLVKGAFSCVLLTRDSLVAFRDAHGIRPLSLGITEDETYVVSSETCGLDAVGANFIREIEPGEMIVINDQGIQSYNIKQHQQRGLCSFEYIYFSRPDSMMEGDSIYKFRELSGRKLWEQHHIEADVVIGVPDSGVPAAIGYSNASGIPFRPILLKNRYLGRSFITPSQEMRERTVMLKLNPIVSEIKGKRVVIMDDSIVRGTTSKRLVNIFKNAGAKEIHFVSASPPIIAPCFLGVDTPEKEHLIAAKNSLEEIKSYLGVDSLTFLSMNNLKDLLKEEGYCYGCFTEKYPVNKNGELETLTNVEA